MSKFNYPDNIPRKGLVFEALLNGNAIDSSGEGNNGSSTDITWLPSERGYTKEVASFNGSSSKIDLLTSVVDTNNSFSFSLWTSINSGTTDKGTILSFRGTSDCRLRYRDTGKIEWAFWDGDTDAYLEANINEGQLFHISLIRDKVNGMQLYIDGKLIASNNEIGDANSYSDTDIIGYLDEYFDGTIGLVRIYNRVLSQNEIQNLYLEGLRKLGPGLLQQYPELFEGAIAYWDFKGDASNLINGTKATVNGATLTTDHLGNSNSAYSFDGVDDYIDTQIEGTNQSDLTVHMLVYINNNSDDEVTFSQSRSSDDIHSRGIRILDGDIDFFSRDSGDKWKEISTTASSGFQVLTYIQRGNIIEMYIGGEYINEYDMGSSTSFNTHFRFGSYTANTDHILNGNIYEVIVYNKAIAASQIKHLYQLTSKKYIYPYASYTPASLPKPVLHINGNRNGDTFFDVSGNGNNGTQSGGVTTGRIGQSKWIGFDGSDDYISHNGPAINDVATFSFWIKPNNAGTGLLSILANGENVRYRISIRDNKLEAIFGGSDSGICSTGDASIIDVENGIYQHYVITVNVSKIEVYKNGKFIQSSNLADTFNTDGTTSLIGCEPDDGDTGSLGNWWPGIIQDIEIFNQALSPKQIETLFYSSYN